MRKLLVIGLAFAGCALVVRAYDLTQLGLNAVGILFGLGAGFTYALFTMFSKAGMKQFSTWTLMTYELFFGALFLLPFQNVHDLAIVIQQPGAWIFLLGLVLGPTLGAITAFNLGVREVPASNASVVATIEPVMASLLAFVLLGERLEVWQLLGGAMVIAGAVWLSGQSR
jgi:drug/metabolite transporter (DMT)-like permease